MTNRLMFTIIASACAFLQYGHHATDTAALPDNNTHHIFFDVGHVLVKARIPKAIWYIGPLSITNYLWQEQKIVGRSALQRRLFAYMDLITKQPPHTSILSCGRSLPNMMYRWVTGGLDYVTMQQMLNNNTVDDKAFFKSDAEKKLILASANLFKPKSFVGMQKVIPEMVVLLKECLAKYPGRVYILSNWDESCDLLKTQFPEIFNNIPDENIIFSHEVGCAKPDKVIFDLAATKAGLEKDHAKFVFIDDCKENIDTNLLPDNLKKTYLALNNNQHNGIRPWGGQGILHISPSQTRKELITILNK